MGHTLASLLVGAKVLEVTLLPIPSVLCDITGVSNTGIVIIGFGGVLFPLISSVLIPRKWFVSWYFRALIQGMSVLALLISSVSIIFGINPQDDMIQVLRFWRPNKELLVVILLLSVVAVFTAVIMDRPLKRICKYFEV